MAGVWEGFTEEELGFLKKNNEGTNETSGLKKKATNLEGLKKKNTARERILMESRSQVAKSETQIPESAKLCKSVPESVPLMEKQDRGKEVPEEKTEEPGPTITSSNPVCLKVIEGKAYELVDRTSADASKATLELFEARQKVLEEQNKRRKEMLAKVISARKKRTTEEAKRLQHIQEELQKLDMLLSNDVGILRNKIEEASLDFVDAQKRYNKAEKEFLDAKQNLFTKLEKKELLTKLLCTIIEQNEMRKAQKLSELMEKLKINEATIEGIPPFGTLILPTDCQSALNGVTENTAKVESNKVKEPS